MRLFRISVLVLLLFFYCSSDVDFQIDKTYTIETIAGVKHIHNLAPAWGDEPKVALEFVQKIGALEATEENFIMYNIGDVGRDNDGNIYILDSGDIRIQKFDSQGEYLTTIGGYGEGPGEFGSPVNLNLDNDGKMYVGDASKYSFIVLDNEGKEIRRFKIGMFNVVRIGQRCRLLTHNRFIMSAVYIAGASKEYSVDNIFSLFHVFDQDGNVIYSFGKPDNFEEDYGVTIFSDAPFDVDKKGNIYIAYRYRNRIEKRDSDGNIEFTVNRLINFEETKFRYEYFANTISLGIAVDHKERIWVITLIKQPKKLHDEWGQRILPVEKSLAVFEIFNKEGILLGSLPLSEDIFLFRIFDDRLFIVDADRVSVSEYKIVEK